MAKGPLVVQQIAQEQFQGPATRKRLYEFLEKDVGLPVVSFATSFKYPVMIEDNDADLLEGVLQKTNVSNGFALLVTSPGGSVLAAERIINICRAYSGSGEYVAVVPGKAKSAASMICLGAARLIMGRTSELGAVDPQFVVEENGQVKWFSVFNLVKSYRDLFGKAVRAKGNLQPYLQQLHNYDAREIAEFEAHLALGEDIAVQALKTGMLSHLSEGQIKKKISIFLTPEEVKVHGRPVYDLPRFLWTRG